MANQNKPKSDWKSLSKLDLIVLGTSFGIGCAERLIFMDENLGTVEYFTNGLYFCFIAGIVRTGFNGIKDGIRRSAIVYAGYMLGQTLVEYTKQQY